MRMEKADVVMSRGDRCVSFCMYVIIQDFVTNASISMTRGASEVQIEGLRFDFALEYPHHTRLVWRIEFARDNFTKEIPDEESMVVHDHDFSLDL